MIQPFGAIFGDELVFGRRVKRHALPEHTSSPIFRSRLIFLCIIFLFGFSVLYARLFTVTLVEGERYRKLASENRIRESVIAAPRGIIYDRNGEQLVRNIPLFSTPDGTIFYEKPPDKNRKDVREGVTRDYIWGKRFAHAVGYIAEINEEELKQFGSDRYKQGSVIGKMGIEQAADLALRGTDGKELIEVDASGNPVRTLGTFAPVSGKTIHLTLDAVLQQAVQENMGETLGAVVVTIPTTGDVLALYSSPSFDPNIFIRSLQISSVLSNQSEPLFNRAISGLYPPGSTFKIITAIAGLESNALKKNTTYADTGVLQVGRFSFGNWYFSQYGKTEGILDVVGALKRSNDIFFYKAGEAIGIDTLSGWAKRFGLGERLGIDIAGEEPGFMPDPAWQKKAKGEDWYLGNTYHAAIGQGDILATPLQVNAFTNVIANGGNLCKPHIVQYQKSNIKDQIESCKDLEINSESVALVKEGMKQACAPGGTGWPLFKFKVPASAKATAGDAKFKVDNMDFFESPEASTSGKPFMEIPIACKTGTAEFGDPDNKTHAWITAFAPVNNPQISVTVLVEKGGEGSSVAGPIAKKIFEAWFGR